jgi:hypothetical protein
MDWYERVMLYSGRSAALWALIGFLVTFAVTRAVTRRIRTEGAQQAREPRPGKLSDIYIGGVHVHHQVWGILLVLVVGLLEFRYNPDPPWSEILAGLFGVGAALTLDEFALWFHLDDVYWGEEGRKSIDAILVAAALGTVLLMQASPAGPDTAAGAAATWSYLAGVALHLLTAVICILKGKLATGLIGIAVPIVATIGAIRLAKPSSVWARRRYGAEKLDRAQHRFGVSYQRRLDRMRDLIGGAPTRSRT